MSKILCIDDTPEEILLSGLSLKDTIEHIFKDSNYQMLFAKTGNEGIQRANTDDEIKLVLLDIDFNKKILGPQIADELNKTAPYLKIIVLTRLDDKGKKISFGWKQNVVHYVLKKEISVVNIQIKLRNLCHAIIDDFTNKNWDIKYINTSDVIVITNTKTKESYGIDIPLTAKPALIKCMKYPNTPVDIPTKEFGKNLNKVHNIVNENVLKGTDWKTWGILSRQRCAKGQLRLVVGKVTGISSETNDEDAYISKSQFEQFKKAVESRLDIIEQALKLKN
jgi:CheY-like chemotaxis protein